jgi:5-methylcytosine-specific restriction protein A
VKRGLPPLPKVVLENGKRPCRGCGGALPPRRSRWCGDACMERAYMALSTHARRRVFERDRGVCALCGCDTDFLRRIGWVLRRRDDVEAMWLVRQAWGQERTPWGVWSGLPQWEADHIVPLVMGGTNDLENYRTLCIPCHRRVTAELARARSRRGRQTEIPLVTAAETFDRLANGGGPFYHSFTSRQSHPKETE